MLHDLDVAAVLQIAEEFRVADLPAGVGGEQFEELPEERGPRKRPEPEDVLVQDILQNGFPDVALPPPRKR